MRGELVDMSQPDKEDKAQKNEVATSKGDTVEDACGFAAKSLDCKRNKSLTPHVPSSTPRNTSSARTGVSQKDEENDVPKNEVAMANGDTVEDTGGFAAESLDCKLNKTVTPQVPSSAPGNTSSARTGMSQKDDEGSVDKSGVATAKEDCTFVCICGSVTKSLYYKRNKRQTHQVPSSDPPTTSHFHTKVCVRKTCGKRFSICDHHPHLGWQEWTQKV